ncbi:MAG: hypothetical protein ACI8W8_003060, partial [Rhodothermales bacterium]
RISLSAIAEGFQLTRQIDRVGKQRDCQGIRNCNGFSRIPADCVPAIAEAENAIIQRHKIEHKPIAPSATDWIIRLAALAESQFSHLLRDRVEAAV